MPSMLYPPIAPYTSGMLAVGGGHRVYHEQCGNPEGVPLVFLHGGPGSGCSPAHRRLFDPTRFRMVFFDQRGCGRSTPRGGLHANTALHLLRDLEQLRKHLGIAQWLVVGGSWGAGLGLAYAAAYPSVCKGLLLRGVFLGRKADLDWFFHQVRVLLPDAWQALVQQFASATADGALASLSHAVLEGAPEEALAAALAWEAWEACVTERRLVAPRHGVAPELARTLVDKYRIQAHYLRHGCFGRNEGFFLKHLQRLHGIPTILLHGRLDWVCRPIAAWEVHARLPGSRLLWIEETGHNPFEPRMVQALATQALALAGQDGGLA